MALMKAVVVHEAGGPEVLRIESRPVPTPKPGEVLIRVKAFGLNRSELFTRQGHSPSVGFPRVLGIEAVGMVAEAPGSEFQSGQIVATAMGGMGRAFDGGYAEYTCVPVAQVQSLDTDLPWTTLGALPETMQTAWGSLFRSLCLEPGEHLLVRGATTSVGLAAAALATNHGATVTGTTRSAGNEALLRESGVDQVIIDTGSIADEALRVRHGGFDKVLEMIGPVTLRDSLRCTREGGLVCMTGSVAAQWSLPEFTPMEVIPTAVRLTTYSGADGFMRLSLQHIVEQISAGTLRVPLGRVFGLDEIIEAHRCMEDNRGGGKIVILT